MSPEAGVDGFVAGLRACGADPKVVDGLVRYVVEPVDGALAGMTVETAVEIAELYRWPLVPPPLGPPTERRGIPHDQQQLIDGTRLVEALEDNRFLGW